MENKRQFFHNIFFLHIFRMRPEFKRIFVERKIRQQAGFEPPERTTPTSEMHW